jgi:hypothetical protein
MQIVVNKVENGYICTLNGKLYVCKNLTEVTAFFIKQFNDSIETGLLQRLICLNPSYESDTSNSE